MTRQEALDICYRAHSRSEIEAAMAVRSRSLLDHPGDEELIHLGEMLSKLLDALDLLGVDDTEPAPFPVVPNRQPATTSRA